MITLLIHINNSEPFKADVEELPQPTDTSIICKNPREKTDKEITWIEEGVTTLIMPMWRVTFVEILPSEDDEVEFPLPFRNE